MKLPPDTLTSFQRTILGHYRKHKREFPWRCTRDPYAILVSEVMLQQTQTDRVVPKYLEWLKRFPNLQSLANAPQREVVKAWQGLGYNRRALHLKRAAEMIERLYGGVIPKEAGKIDALPGVGPYTAKAVAAFAFGAALPFVETNIRAVYLYFFFNERKKVRDEEILNLVARTLPGNKVRSSFRSPPALRLWRAGKAEPCSVREWYNALMDYGAMLKKIVGNPNARSARYVKQSAFRGSRRELRGKILQCAAQKGNVTPKDFRAYRAGLSLPTIFSELVSEGFLRKKGDGFSLA